MITFVEYHNRQQILPGLFPSVFSSTPSYEMLHIICLMTVPHCDAERLCQDQKNHKPSNWSLSVNQEERYLIVPSLCTNVTSIFLWLTWAISSSKLFCCPVSLYKFCISDFFSRFSSQEPLGKISIGPKHSWVKGIQVFQNKVLLPKERWFKVIENLLTFIKNRFMIPRGRMEPH